MSKEIIITHPDKKEGTTGLLIQILGEPDNIYGVYIGRFWDKEMIEQVFVDGKELKDLIEKLEGVLEE